MIVAGAMLGVASSASRTAPYAGAACTARLLAADLARVSAGVASATSDYLYSHPGVNDFFTSLHGLPNDEIPNDVRIYMDANPQVRAELTAIRQPVTDLRNNCQR